MDVSGVMDTYNLNTLWNNLNPNSSSEAVVPLVDNVDNTVNENYTANSYFGQTSSNELQDIYQQVEPDYGIQLTYDQNGNLSIPTTTSLPSDGLSAEDSNIISLLNSDNSSSENSFSNILNQYDSIEDGTFNSTISSILSNDPSNLYSYIDSLSGNQTQSVGSNLEALV